VAISLPVPDDGTDDFGEAQAAIAERYTVSANVA